MHGSDEGGVTRELAKVCQQSYMSVMGHNKLDHWVSRRSWHILRQDNWELGDRHSMHLNIQLLFVIRDCFSV